MIPPNLAVYALLAVAIGGFVLAGGVPLALGTDIGLTDESICETVDANGAYSVERLTATGFPHASTQPQERYRLTTNNEVKAAIEIDWFNGNAYCAPLDATETYTVSFDMNAGAYTSLVRELKHVIEKGETSGSWGTYGRIAWGTDVTRPGGEHDRAYRVELASWAAGRAGG